MLNVLLQVDAQVREQVFQVNTKAFPTVFEKIFYAMFVI